MKQLSNPESDRYLAITITPEDEAYARKQNRFNCAIVRAIQRQVPDALRVMADTRHIAFSLERDDMRYEFDTPAEVVEKIIKPFDRGLPLELYSFQLINPTSATPILHRTVQERQTQRTAVRNSRVRTQNTAVHSFNRFLDEQAESE